MSAELLVGHIFWTLINDGIELQLIPKKRIEAEGEDTMIGGFSEDEKLLELATKRKDWHLILAHEFCHYLQWKEGYFDNVAQIAAYAMFQPWLQKKRDLPSDMVTDFIREMQSLELDNEKRTLALLKKFDVEFDKEDYIRKSNVYLLSYEITRRVRKPTKKTIYETTPEILKLVSGKKLISEDDFEELPEGFETLALLSYDFSEKEEEE